MVEFDKQVQHTSYKAKLLLQVHDELIFEVPKSEVENLVYLLKISWSMH